MRWPLLPVLLVASCDFLPACGGSQPTPLDVLEGEYRAAQASCVATAPNREEAQACLVTVDAAFAERWKQAQGAKP